MNFPVALRRGAVAALIAALAACSSAPAASPTEAPASSANANPTAVPTAVPTAAAPSGLSWEYTRDEVAQNFIGISQTLKPVLVFVQEGADYPGPKPDPTWVDSQIGGDPFISIQGAAADGASKVTAVVIQSITLPGSTPPTAAGNAALTFMTFSVHLMTDPEVALEAGLWIQSEIDKANADKNTEVKDTKIFGSTQLQFEANVDLGSDLRSGAGLRIEPAL